MMLHSASSCSSFSLGNNSRSTEGSLFFHVPLSERRRYEINKILQHNSPLIRIQNIPIYAMYNIPTYRYLRLYLYVHKYVDVHERYFFIYLIYVII